MVREESHLDEMRAAIRGDFERLERRRGGQELMHVSEDAELEEAVTPPEPAEPLGAEVDVVEPEPEPAPSEEPPEADIDDVPEPAPGPDTTRSWLDRLLAR